MKPSKRNLRNAALRAEARTHGAPSLSRYARKRAIQFAPARDSGPQTQEKPDMTK